MTVARVALAWVLVALVCVVGHAQAPTPTPTPTSDSELDERVRAFSRNVRCLVCQNESLAESRSTLAGDLRREIRDRMKAGKSDHEIVAFLTARYGDFVLYRPLVKPTTYLLWFGPYALLAGGAFAVFRAVRAGPRRSDRRLASVDRRRAQALLRSHPEEGPY